MKTAKEITEYLVKEGQRCEEQNRNLTYVIRPEGYSEKMETLEKLREFMLEWEYYPDNESAMKGIEYALRWVLSDSGGAKT